jgi:hypothetical protein
MLTKDDAVLAFVVVLFINASLLDPLHQIFKNRYYTTGKNRILCKILGYISFNPIKLDNTKVTVIACMLFLLPTLMIASLFLYPLMFLPLAVIFAIFLYGQYCRDLNQQRETHGHNDQAASNKEG